VARILNEFALDEAGLSGRTTQADGTLDSGTVYMGFHYPVPSRASID